MTKYVFHARTLCYQQEMFHKVHSKYNNSHYLRNQCLLEQQDGKKYGTQNKGNQFIR